MNISRIKFKAMQIWPILDLKNQAYPAIRVLSQGSAITMGFIFEDYVAWNGTFQRNGIPLCSKLQSWEYEKCRNWWTQKLGGIYGKFLFSSIFTPLWEQIKLQGYFEGSLRAHSRPQTPLSPCTKNSILILLLKGLIPTLIPIFAWKSHFFAQKQ